MKFTQEQLFSVAITVNYKKDSQESGRVLMTCTHRLMGWTGFSENLSAYQRQPKSEH
jgi:hypothetical protein